MSPRPAPTPSYDYSSIPEGFYQTVVEEGHPVRRAWHLQKFQRVLEAIPQTAGQSILDIGCFAGTFLSALPEEIFTRQLGVDIVAKQIDYAERRFGAPHRKFRHIENIAQLAQINERFDCITLIEVIEHLAKPEIANLMSQVVRLSNPGSYLVLSTPNYASTWPVIEKIVNWRSEVRYEEQHITKFTYFNAVERLLAIAPALAENFELSFKTTTHFFAPFLAGLSFKGSMKLSSMVPHRTWRNPFGNLVLMCFRRKGA